MSWDALRLTLQVALTSTVFAVVLGVPFAWWLSRRRSWLGDALSVLVVVPMVLPPTVLGFYLLQAIGKKSAIGSALDSVLGFSFVFDWSGAVLAAFIVSTPFLIRTAMAGFQAVDRTYEDAARTLGRNELQIFLMIAVPLAWRSIAAGIALALARAVGEFGATLMVAGNVPGRTQTMSVAIYDAVQSGRTDDARVLAISLTLVAAGLLVAVAFAGRRGGVTWR